MDSTTRALTPAAREFADACHSNRIEEMEAALRQRAADRTDCETWGITPSQWRLAIQTALSERQGEREARSSAARALRAIPSEARSEQSRSNGRRGGRPAILGTITAEGGRATVRYSPGRGRVECVLPDGTVEIPEEASVSSLEEARRTAEAWYGERSSRVKVWDWQPRGSRSATTIYTLSSVKGQHGTVAGYRAACARAREIQSDLQAAYGIDVSHPDGMTVYTAR